VRFDRGVKDAIEGKFDGEKLPAANEKKPLPGR